MTTNPSSCFHVIPDSPQIVAMSTGGTSETEIKAQTQKKLRETKDPVEKLRLALLLRGSSGIKEFGRTFRIMDDNENQKLDIDEFTKGLKDISRADVEGLFKKFDKDGSGHIDFDEFLKALRPPMSSARVKLIEAAFKKMDKTGDGVVTVADMEGVYDHRKHPKFISGELTKQQVFELYLKNFEIDGNPDGKVTWEEFLNYYSGVSAYIDQDIYFDLMMRNAWKL